MTSGMPDLNDLQQMSQNLEQFAEATQRRATQFQQVGDKLADATVTERAEGGEVKVTVASSGALQDLQLGDGIAALPPNKIAAKVMTCVQRAQARIADEAQQIVDDTVTDDSAESSQIAGNIVGRLRREFPAPAESETSGDDDVLRIGDIEEPGDEPADEPQRAAERDETRQQPRASRQPPRRRLRDDEYGDDEEGFSGF